jgi:GDSL-like Lipase/Acylhydrolase family/PEP-CTERM motif
VSGNLAENRSCLALAAATSVGPDSLELFQLRGRVTIYSKKRKRIVGNHETATRVCLIKVFDSMMGTLNYLVTYIGCRWLAARQNRSDIVSGLGLLLIMATTHVAQAQYTTEINRWLAEDALAAPPSNSVLFIGSSSIRRWENLAHDFYDYNIIQRGLGGSQISDLTPQVNNIVLPYNPAAIVMFAGTNDVDAGKSANTVFNDYVSFVDAVHSGQNQSLPPIPIMYIGITPNPSRWSEWSTASQVNSLVENYAASDSSLYYVDTVSSFLALNPPSDPAFTSLFQDGLHLTPEAYHTMWTSVVKPDLQAVSPSQKTFVPNPSTPTFGKRILFDFGPSNPLDGNHTVGPDANGNIWNNWHDTQGGATILAGEHLANLVTTDGAPTGINMTITGGFLTNGIRTGGLVNPSPALLGDFAVATATEDYFYGDNEDNPAGLMLDGLNPNVKYDFRFFGTRNVSSARVTQYTVEGANSASATLKTSGVNIGVDGVYDGNDDEIASVFGVRPDAFGQVFIDVKVIQGSLAYLGIMEMTVATPEPSTAVMLLTGSGLCLLARRRRAQVYDA